MYQAYGFQFIYLIAQRTEVHCYNMNQG